jgi:hypothetical protein
MPDSEWYKQKQTYGRSNRFGPPVIMNLCHEPTTLPMKGSMRLPKLLARRRILHTHCQISL